MQLSLQCVCCKDGVLLVTNLHNILEHHSVCFLFTPGKLCDKPLLKETQIFPDRIFSGRNSENYSLARFANGGWCPRNSSAYLLIDLQREYHITRVVVMANKNQTKWSGSYLMKYSRDKTYKHDQKVNYLLFKRYFIMHFCIFEISNSF